MIKKTTISAFILILLTLIRCAEKKSDEINILYNDSESKETLTLANNDTLIGIYMGSFDGTDLRLIINHVSKKHIIGYTVVKGIRRNVSGNYEIEKQYVSVKLSEPGDLESDGVYEFKLNKVDFTINGKWTQQSNPNRLKFFKLKKIILSNNYDETTIDNTNFTDIIYHVEDSVGFIDFKENGFCIYSYYPKTDSINRVEQLIEVKGSWTIKNNDLIINWQPNKIFKSPISKFKISTTDSQYTISNDERVFYNTYF